jgi:hypothetical protein
VRSARCEGVSASMVKFCSMVSGLSYTTIFL